jgi:hypothetical protein
VKRIELGRGVTAEWDAIKSVVVVTDGVHRVAVNAKTINASATIAGMWPGGLALKSHKDETDYSHHIALTPSMWKKLAAFAAAAQKATT